MKLLLEQKPRKNIKNEMQIRLSKKKRPKHKKLEYDATFQQYIREVEKITGIPLHPEQRRYLRKTIQNKSYYRLKPEQTREVRKEFNRMRNDIVKEWEYHTGMKWPVHEEHVYNKHGEIMRHKGSRYEAHHLIEVCFGGQPDWKNIHPVHTLDHRPIIHRKGGLADKIFNS